MKLLKYLLVASTALSLLVYGGVIAFGATRDDEAHDAAL